MMADTTDTKADGEGGRSAEKPRRARRRKAAANETGTATKSKPSASRRSDNAKRNAKVKTGAKRADRATKIAKNAAAGVRKASDKVAATPRKAVRAVRDSAESAGVTRKGLIAGATVAAVGVVAGLAATLGRKRIVAASGDIKEAVTDGAAKVKDKIDEVRGTKDDSGTASSGSNSAA